MIVFRFQSIVCKDATERRISFSIVVVIVGVYFLWFLKIWDVFLSFGCEVGVEFGNLNCSISVSLISFLYWLWKYMPFEGPSRNDCSWSLWYNSAILSMNE